VRQFDTRSESAERFFVGLAAVATMIRERDGLSQREVARRAGVGRPLISKVERGRANPTAMCLDKLAKGLGLTGVAELVVLADESATRLAASIVRPST
jgi:transcriptional regulator with XRE-family HTH domain